MVPFTSTDIIIPCSLVECKFQNSEAITEELQIITTKGVKYVWNRYFK